MEKPTIHFYATGDAILIEHTSNDRYWADGGDGTGRNRLGEILMQVRGELASDALIVSKTPDATADRGL